MRVLLDTYILLWWHDQPERLTNTAREAISNPDNDVFMSVVNGWEIQIKAQLGKLELSKPLDAIIHEEQVVNDFKLLPITIAHVYTLDRLPLYHRDPFDRLLVAQATHEELTMITHDPKLSAYAVSLLW